MKDRREQIRPVMADPEHGLSNDQVRQRLEGGWTNRVTVKSGRTVPQIIFQNTFTFFNLVFVILALILALAGSTVLNMTFMVVVLVNTAIGCIHEIRAKRAVDALSLVAQQRVCAVRQGQPEKIPSDLLVRDDIVEFRAGDQICADAQVLTGQLVVNEALITGEADGVVKTPGTQLRSGSFVISGCARVRLTQVGNDGYAARLAAEAKADPRAAKSEMMRSLDRLIRVVGCLLIPIGIVVFWSQLRTGSTLLAGTESTVAALVGMIPEGLYLLTSVAVAVSALKLTRQRVLVRDMNCIEALARVDVLCVDKTGTITQPDMQVQTVTELTEGGAALTQQVLCGLYAGRTPDNDTAAAICRYVTDAGDWECTRYIPFSSDTKWCGGEFSGRGAFAVGAPDVLMGSGFSRIRDQVLDLSQQGSRVLLAVRCGGLEEKKVTDPEPLALIALSNSLRPNAVETFDYFTRQGVEVKVISGDSPEATSQVAVRAGIAQAHRYVDAQTLETPEQYIAAVRDYTVFGRVTPHKKRKLLAALRSLGHTVAMTGDGVNDVLAMKESDCAIAMASGSQAASQIARLVLVDSDFSAMPGIVNEGRRVINNIQRAATLFLVKNIFAMGCALITVFAGLQFPLEPFNLSIVSALTIGIPGFFLALEPNYQRVSGRFLPTVLRRALPGGLTNVIMVLAVQMYMTGAGMPLADMQAACTAVLGAVGLLVLFQVSRPFTLIRRILWAVMAIVFAGAFLVLPPVTGYLQITDLRTLWVILAGVALCPAVFLLLQGAFVLADKLLGKKKL